MSYIPDAKRYDGTPLRRCGRSGIVHTAISLERRQNFGDVNFFETGRAMIGCAVDRGISIRDEIAG
jgi:L-glyceraldehyde 3-phosphate reductase